MQPVALSVLVALLLQILSLNDPPSRLAPVKPLFWKAVRPLCTQWEATALSACFVHTVTAALSKLYGRLLHTNLISLIQSKLL